MSSAVDRFAPRLRQAIVSRLGWRSLRPVQELASHALLDGHNAVILAPTAGGKTEASIFPLLSQMVDHEPEGLGMLYLAPIKALLNNQAERLGTYTEMVGLRRFLWHGDIAASAKKAFLSEPTCLLMTTPESLEVMLLSSRVPHPTLFAGLRAVVVDEVHALAGSDRGAHLMSVVERLAVHSRHDVQRVGLSATVGNPGDILDWLQGTSKRARSVIDPPKHPTPKDLRILTRETLANLATEASAEAAGHKSLFFCQSRALAEGVAERMRGRGTEVFVHHSSVSVEQRREAEEQFHRGSNACIVCTSTLELGIDVGDLDRVFQADAPSSVSSFLQRLGRTGRRENQRGHTTFYCESPETALQAVALIELARRHWVEPVPIRRRCWPVLVHQLIAMAFEHGAVRADEAWKQLHQVPDFSGIDEAEFHALVEHLVAEDFLWRDRGDPEARLSIGDRTEKVFGRKNFMELYAVFSTPKLYQVVSASGRDIGHLEQGFVDKLVEDMSSFLLGGHAWTVARIHHRDRRIVVTAAPRGRKPSWGGFAPQLLSYELCQEMARILTASEPIPYADPVTMEAIEEQRRDLGALLRRPGLSVQNDGLQLQWWTFAGGAANHAIRYGLARLEAGWKIRSDNSSIRIEGDGLRVDQLSDYLDVLADPTFWQDNREWFLHALPDYRLSKFQQALPPGAAMEMIQDHLLDIPKATRVCQEVDRPGSELNNHAATR
ncbi:MAG: DEAD/DEAH box helicase [Acidobacteriota bacterium]